MDVGQFEVIQPASYQAAQPLDSLVKAHGGRFAGQLLELTLEGVPTLRTHHQLILMDIVENSLSENDFGVDHLSRKMGISQPQLYLKISSITVRSPVSFIHDIRLNKALSLIKESK